MRNPAEDPRYTVDVIKNNYYGTINVSDTPCMTFEYQNAGIKACWFPIHEVGYWGYAPFYGTAKFLDQKLRDGDERPILLHCHAGVNRSVCVAYANLLAVGVTQPEINEKITIGEGLPTLLEININKGYIPSDIVPFLQARKDQPTYGIMGLLQTISSPNSHLRRENQKSIQFRGVEL